MPRFLRTPRFLQTPTRSSRSPLLPIFLIVLVDILGSAQGAGGASSRASSIAASDLAAIEELLREGQRDGEFRQFDTRVMAVAVLALRNAVIGRLAADPELDLEPYRRELVTLIELATRK